MNCQLLVLVIVLPLSWCYDCTRPNKDDIYPWHDDSGITHTVIWQLETVCVTDLQCYGFEADKTTADYVQLCPLRIQLGDVVHLEPPPNGSIYHMRPTNVSWDDWISCPKKDHPEEQKLYRDNQTSPIIVSSKFLQTGETYLAQSENGVFSDCKYGLRIIINIMSHDCKSDQSDEMCSGHGLCGIRLIDDEYRCFCDGGYKGRYCEDIDGCYGVMCYNNGSCVDLPEETFLETGRQYSCLCADGFLGSSCSLVQGLCTAGDCVNNGSCNQYSEDLFSCHCQPGFSGSFCEDDINKCLSSPCYGSATCVDSINSFTCLCDDKYTSQLCDILTYNPCLSTPCYNNANCSYLLTGEVICKCPNEFTGKFCEESTNACYSSPCFNGGTCVPDISDHSSLYTCVCAQYLTGAFCEQLIGDPCESNPCSNSGKCIRSNGGFHCVCPATASGKTCEISIPNPCDVDPCQNGATCMKSEDGFICVCLFGYYGNRCAERSKTMCAPNPCRNGGYCVLTPGGLAQCQCSPGWTGSMCQSLQNMCLNTPCNNGTICLDTSTSQDPGTFLCVCPQGYQGQNCKTEINECESSPCHTGTCVDGLGGYNCSCPIGYNGTNCNLDIDACQVEGREVCLNGATCVDSPMGMEFSCACAPGFTGVDCGTNIDECVSDPCQNNATCIDGNHGYQCQCATGYQGNHCQDEIDYCLSEPCLNNATCSSFLPGPVCDCSPGYTGQLCNVDINDCVSRPCLNGGFCMDGINTFWCVCFARFTGPLCETAVPPPCESNPCYNNATCQNKENSNTFKCICGDGFEGETCETEINYCMDNDCQNNATCINTRTGYHCLCLPGYSDEICWTEINECDANPCVTGVCQDRLNGYECFCPNGQSICCTTQTGYQGKNCSENVDECALEFCHKNNTASCEDGIASYTCVCKPGYSGTLCLTNIDECVNHKCLNGARCVDQINTYICDCSPGYTGTFCESDIDDCASFPCQPGSCIDQLGGYTCVCLSNDHFHDDNCNILPPCTANLCQNNSTCINDFELYLSRCSCIDGFDGDFCENERNECLHYEIYCNNRGTCVDLFNNYTCECVEGFEGELCEIDLNACRSPDILCENNSTCVDAPNGYTCTCLAGFKGIYCGDVAESCTDDPCINGATCLDKNNVEMGNNFTCLCSYGFTGVLCEQNIDDCISGVCGIGTCLDGVATYSCICPTGFTGTTCMVNIDDCADNQCVEGATCIDDVDEYSCLCTVGFTGELCELPVDECLSDPCQNGGLCVDEHNGYSCYCRNGFTGVTCNENYDECASAPCLYGGTCQDDIAGFVCQCVAGFTGARCSEHIDECSSSPCLNLANCTDLVNSYRCDCMQGFSGVHCETEINECLSSPCVNDGMCRDLVGAYICDCPQPYRGDNCQYLPCELSPCGDRGLCTNDLTALPLGFRCQCFDGFTGSRCQLSIDDCRTSNGSAPCSGRGYCADGQNTYTCYCAPGWKGKDCELSVDECPEADCRNNATCINRLSGYICQCPDGYDGQFCERESDECDPSPCYNSATCVDLFNNYTCQCPMGWTGRDCDLQINECQLTGDNPCENGGTCVDMIADFSCACAPFYTGRYCDVSFDPCQEGYNQCENDARCTTYDNGTYSCHCPDGFIGKNCERDEDDCASTPCQHASRCEDLLLAYKCHCLQGFSGPNCEVNINDCVPEICRNNGSCIDMVNEYMCNCTGTGYEGDQCTVDIDECLNDPCLNNGQCTNTLGSYSCLCPALYTGVHCETKIDPCVSAPCENGALCAESGATYVCYCKLGYTGRECHINIIDCHPDLCLHGSCEDLANDYICHCDPGWSGRNCTDNINECLSNPCLNSKECRDDIDGYTCVCLDGYSGDHCEIDLSFCINPVTNASPCQNGATCIEASGANVTCLCSDGFTGQYCENDINACLSTPCQNNATCTNGLNNYTCLCDSGWTGINCEVNVDECESQPCINNGLCMKMDPEPGYECVCPSGFGGIHCELNYDDCAPGPKCSNGGTCIDEVNNYTCLCIRGTAGHNCDEIVAETTTSQTLEPITVSTKIYQTSLPVTSTIHPLLTSVTESVIITSEVETMTTGYPPSLSLAKTDSLATTHALPKSVLEMVMETSSFGVGISPFDFFTVYSSNLPMTPSFDLDLASSGVVTDIFSIDYPSLSDSTFVSFITPTEQLEAISSTDVSQFLPEKHDTPTALPSSTDSVTVVTMPMMRTEIPSSMYSSFTQTSSYSTVAPNLFESSIMIDSVVNPTQTLSPEIGSIYSSSTIEMFSEVEGLRTSSGEIMQEGSLVSSEASMLFTTAAFSSVETSHLTIATDYVSVAATQFSTADVQLATTSLLVISGSFDPVSGLETIAFKTSTVLDASMKTDDLSMIYSSLIPSETVEFMKTIHESFSPIASSMNDIELETVENSIASSIHSDTQLLSTINFNGLNTRINSLVTSFDLASEYSSILDFETVFMTKSFMHPLTTIPVMFSDYSTNDVTSMDVSSTSGITTMYTWTTLLESKVIDIPITTMHIPGSSQLTMETDTLQDYSTHVLAEATFITSTYPSSELISIGMQTVLDSKTVASTLYHPASSFITMETDISDYEIPVATMTLFPTLTSIFSETAFHSKITSVDSVTSFLESDSISMEMKTEPVAVSTIQVSSILDGFASDFSVMKTSVFMSSVDSFMSSHDATETHSGIYSVEPSMTSFDQSSKTYLLVPSLTLSVEPSNTFSVEPFKTLSMEPSEIFSVESAKTLSMEPSKTFSVEPSEIFSVELIFSEEPSLTFSVEPSDIFSVEPSKIVSVEPSKAFSVEPSEIFSVELSKILSVEPSKTFSMEPSVIFSVEPSEIFSVEPSEIFSVEPSKTLSVEPSKTFSVEPSVIFSMEPSVIFSVEPSEIFSVEPSKIFSVEPSKTFSVEPSEIFSMESSKILSVEPSKTFSMEPSVIFSVEPSEIFSVEPSKIFSVEPSKPFSVEPSEIFSVESSKIFSVEPSKTFSMEPSVIFSVESSDIFSVELSKIFSVKPSKTFSVESSEIFSVEPSMTFSVEPSNIFETSFIMDTSSFESAVEHSTTFSDISSEMILPTKPYMTFTVEPSLFVSMEPSESMIMESSSVKPSKPMSMEPSIEPSSVFLVESILSDILPTSTAMIRPTSVVETNLFPDKSPLVSEMLSVKESQIIPSSDVLSSNLFSVETTKHMESSISIMDSEFLSSSMVQSEPSFYTLIHTSFGSDKFVPDSTPNFSSSIMMSGTEEQSLWFTTTESLHTSYFDIFPSSDVTIATELPVYMTTEMVTMETLHVSTVMDKDLATSAYLSSIEIETISPTPSSTIAPTATIATTPVSMTTEPPLSSNCSGVVCFNGGVCVELIDQKETFTCECQVGFEGNYCEIARDYDSVSYNMTSYLQFGPPVMVSHNIIEVTFTTSEMFGLLLYSSRDYSVEDSTHFVHLFIQDGFLKYQFSCIAESFVLDSGVFVSTGDQFNVTVIQYTGCRASLNVDYAFNHTYIELGMNFVFNALRLDALSDLFLGGLPANLTYLPQNDLHNFTGCMGPVRWNGELLAPQSAQQGKNIIECPVADAPIISPTTTSPPSEQTTTEPTLPLTCADVTCENGGVCQDVTIDGLFQYQCSCQLHYEGDTCDEEIAIHFPSFSGDSYLQHNDLDLSSGTGNLYLTFKTSTSSGTLLYADASDGNFVHLFIEDAVLKYQLTCGATSVLVLDTQIDVSHGNLTNVAINHLINPGKRECQISISVDSQAPQSSTLVTSRPPIPPILGPIYLGGLPHGYVAKSRTSPLIGYVGCIREMEVNGDDILVFSDAVTGQNILDCMVEACFYEPCLNNGSCIVNGEGWYCSCSHGYKGPLCERDTCDYNPCLHGSTCIFTMATGSHICLCPYGRHGVTCDDVLEVTRPQFAGSVQGYSSYMAYPMVKDLDFDLEIRFNFTVNNHLLLDGLLLYAGHKGNQPGPGSDFILVGIKQGHLVYRFDLGSGMADIKGAHPINTSMTQHFVQLGRSRQDGWLILDDQVKVTGKSPGGLVGLNVYSQFYIGGLDFFIKEALPKGMDFDSGFSGCMYNLELRVGSHGRWYSMQKERVISGRNIQQCGVSECLIHGCYHGGTCVDLGATFRCDCPMEYKGPLCADTVTPCDGPHSCAPGAVCVPQAQGQYRCHCALGQYGTYCDGNITITDPKFIGESSYMAFTPPPGLRNHLAIEIQFRPTVANGLLLYIAEYLSEMTSDFLSIELWKNRVNLRYNTGTMVTTVIRSNNTMGDETVWHRLLVGRNLTHGYIELDGVRTEGAAQPGLVSLDVTTLLYLGGLPDLSLVTPSAVQNEPITFEGCVRYLVVNGYQLMLNEKGPVEGLNIGDCDGTPCGYGICHNEGQCVTQGDGQVTCKCSQDFYGSFCEESTHCLDSQCVAGATCLPDIDAQNYTCLCPLGTAGQHCQQNTSFTAARFTKQTSYIMVDRSNNLNARSTYIAFNMSSTRQGALIVWTGKVYSDIVDYFGIGIDEGRLKVIVSLGLFAHGEIISDTIVDDGQWHQVIVIRDGKRLSVHLDADVYVAVIEGEYLSLDTDGLYYIGGFGSDSSVFETTQGRFQEIFSGCLSGLQFSVDQPIVLLENSTIGADIVSCDGR